MTMEMLKKKVPLIMSWNTSNEWERDHTVTKQGKKCIKRSFKVKFVRLLNHMNGELLYKGKTEG